MGLAYWLRTSVRVSWIHIASIARSPLVQLSESGGLEVVRSFYTWVAVPRALLLASRPCICHPVIACKSSTRASVPSRSSHPRTMTSWSEPIEWSWSRSHIGRGPSPRVVRVRLMIEIPGVDLGLVGVSKLLLI
jgi:hypothetical protein